MGQQTAGTDTEVRVDQSVCIGAGQCVFVAPEVFTQRDDDGVVELLDPNPDDDQLAAVEEAVEVCPAQVISVVRGGSD